MSIGNNRELKRALLGTLCSIALLSWSRPAHAVENIRNVTWEHPQAIAWDPQVSQASVTFEADITALEAAFAITSLSIAVVHGVGSPEILYRGVIGPLSPGAAGTPARFQVDLSMSCDPIHKNISIGLVRATMHYLQPVIGTTTIRLFGQERQVSASSRESVGLAILDQDGVASLQSLPGDTFACLNGPDEPYYGTVGVYFDQAGTQCSGTIPAGGVGKVYVVAKVAGPTAGGIAGAEFRFDGMPSAWEAYAVPNPQILAIGDPFGDGVTMGFVCRSPVEEAILLYTVVVFADEDVSDVLFDIHMRRPPLNTPCPLLIACDEPVFTKYCVEGLTCYVNSSGTTPCGKPVAVEAASWSTVKALYR